MARRKAAKDAAKALAKSSLTSKNSGDEVRLEVSARPKRLVSSNPQYTFGKRSSRTSIGSNSTSEDAVATEAPQKRGRPSGSMTAGEQSKSKSKSRNNETTKARKSSKRIKLSSDSEDTFGPNLSDAKTSPKGNDTSPDPEEDFQWKRMTEIVIPRVDSSACADTDPTDDEDSHLEPPHRQYWLMKAEPNDRFENGHNVKFSIDDLAAASSPEPWDGVRNYVARNNMRAMRVGDLAFFYHSNCPVPGVVGVMRIVKEHTPDESAFNPQHPYFDPKSNRDVPKWDVVHVSFVKKFDKQITLKMMNENAASTKELADMQALKQKRLSVTAVTSEEWQLILDLAGEDPKIGEHDRPLADYHDQWDGFTEPHM